ncbi:MAG: DUF1638 domain-containing protein [Gammaproteobacteria bacterium]|nr:DUF1638 domain-containing protein [Gammaproteobacteria bacterium]
MTTPAKTLVLACGAISHELVAVLKANDWHHIDIQCLPADWHNTPELIAPAIEQKILENQLKYDRILVGYGDCGSGGKLDVVLKKYGVERLPGDHCYAFFAGVDVFQKIYEDEIGTFYLTDYLATFFDRLILEGFGIKKHPELRDMYFGNYTRVLYLAQTENENMLNAAKAAASAINLPLEVHYTGLNPFQQALEKISIVEG